MMAGEYKIAYVIEQPKAWYDNSGGPNGHHEPSGSFFISVAVRDGYDGRTIPDLGVTAQFIDVDGQVVTETKLPFGYHPLLNRYGDNRCSGEACR